MQTIITIVLAIICLLLLLDRYIKYLTLKENKEK